MFARAGSGTLDGVTAQAITVESHRANGLPGMAVIGLVRGAMKESAVRVRSAIVAAGFKLPAQRLLVNFSPAEVPKQAAGLDLALAASLLGSAGVLPAAALQRRRFYGELSLGGAIEPVHGALLLAELALRCGDVEVLVPQQNAAEAALVSQVRVVGVATLAQMVAYLRGELALERSAAAPPQAGQKRGCFAEVQGQQRAKRAMAVAAAGGHNLLLVGAPGSGKSMLAQRFVGLLPPLTAEQAIEVTRLHAAAHLLHEPRLITAPPFVAPHHTLSEAALCGGGTAVPRPGQLSLAHRGVLFLDELPEFSRRCLESLREPLEAQCIRIARSGQARTYPADVLLLAAMNPCPCGHALPLSRQNAAGGSGPMAACTCSFASLQHYRARLSGPLLDRLDLQVHVERVAARDCFAPRRCGPTSETLAAKVAEARQLQRARGQEVLNARLDATQLRQVAPLSEACMQALEAALGRVPLSMRAVHKIIRVARTLADMTGDAQLHRRHIDEAIDFRLLDL